MPSAAAYDDDHDDDQPAVTCGSVIQLQHVHTSAKPQPTSNNMGTAYLLYDTEGKNRNGGSGQHLATFVKDQPTDKRALWRIRSRHHHHKDNDGNNEYPSLETTTSTILATTCTSAAEPIRCGDVVRLSNLETRRNLHSHNVKSPLSNQQEVTAVEDGNNPEDDWKVLCANHDNNGHNKNNNDNSSLWRRGQSIKLQHVVTGKCLGANSGAEFNVKTCGRNCPLMNHLESFGRDCTDALSDLRTGEQGIYLSV